MPEPQDSLKRPVVEDEGEAPTRLKFLAKRRDCRGDGGNVVTVHAPDQVLPDAERERNDGGVEVWILRRAIATQIGRAQKSINKRLRRADAARGVALFGGCVLWGRHIRTVSNLDGSADAESRSCIKSTQIDPAGLTRVLGLRRVGQSSPRLVVTESTCLGRAGQGPAEQETAGGSHKEARHAEWMLGLPRKLLAGRLGLLFNPSSGMSRVR